MSTNRIEVGRGLRSAASARAPQAIMMSSNAVRWRSILILVFLLTVAAMVIGVGSAIFSVLRQAFGFSTTFLGLFTSLALLARAIGGPVWGLLADRFGRKRVLVTSAGLWSVCVAAIGLAQTQAQFVTLLALAIAAAVGVEPIATAFISELFADAERGKAFGVGRGLLSFGVALGMPLLGWLAAKPDGWRTTFFVLGGAQMLGACLAIAGLGERPRADGAGRAPAFSARGVRRAWAIPTVRLLAVAYALATSMVMLAYLPSYWVEHRGFSLGVATSAFGTLQAGSILGSVLGGLAGDWIERIRPGRGRIQMMQIYLCTFALLSWVNFQVPVSHRGALYVLAFVTGVVYPIGFSGCVLPMLAAVTAPEIRGAAFGLLASFFQGASLAVISFLVGAWGDRWGLTRMLVCAITVPYLVNAAVWFGFYSIYPRDAARQGQPALDAADETKTI
jgi:MFS family permease